MKVSLPLFIIGLFAFAMMFLILGNEMTSGALKQRINHKWCVTSCGDATGQANGYSAQNQDCQNRCQLNNGISCGKEWQNCCVSNQCVDHFYGDICNERIPVANCTSA